MEWNFLFRVDHLNEKGEERNLKGIIITEENQTPTVEQIQKFLLNSGYQVELHDPEELIFMDHNQRDPIKITIVKMGNEMEEKVEPDRVIRSLSQQFRKNYNM
ncbi:hypothetical protein ACQCN2_11915 [Brevibacillus ginsengisoli]|uniref:hypothetical protein n=1 Tax=Brevibacillus ginsengisoli TaxID=363854 RepID=UPI003CEE474C